VEFSQAGLNRALFNMTWTLLGDWKSWGAYAVISLLLGRLAILQCRELRKNASQWWNYIITMLTAASIAFLAVLYLGNLARSFISALLVDGRSYLETLYQGLSLQEIIPWVILAVIVLFRVFRWLAPSMAPTPGIEDTTNSPKTTVIVHPSPAINIAGLESLGTALGNVLNPFFTSMGTASPTVNTGIEKRLMELEKTLQATLEYIKDIVTTLDGLPKVNTLASSLLQIADLVHEEGAATRQVVRDVGEDTEQDDVASDTAESVGARTDVENNYELEHPLICAATISKNESNKKKGVSRVAQNKKLKEIKPIPVLPSETLLDELKPKPPVIMTPEDVQSFIGKTQQEVVIALNNREKERREQDRLPAYLTEAEKNLARKSLATLDRQWRMKAGWKLKHTDYIEIGHLTEEQLQLPRNLVLRTIRNRRADSFIEQLKIQGREAARCPTCRKLYPMDSVHNCFVAAGWSKPAKRDGVPATREMLITQTGRGGIQIRQQVGVDAEKLNENYKKITEYKMTLDDEKHKETNQQASPAKQNPQNDLDAEMVDVAASGEPAVVLMTQRKNSETTWVTDATTGQVFRLVPC
jgi:hypothetical protein